MCIRDSHKHRHLGRSLVQQDCSIELGCRRRDLSNRNQSKVFRQGRNQIDHSQTSSPLEVGPSPKLGIQHPIVGEKHVPQEHIQYYNRRPAQRQRHHSSEPMDLTDHNRHRSCCLRKSRHSLVSVSSSSFVDPFGEVPGSTFQIRKASRHRHSFRRSFRRNRMTCDRRNRRRSFRHNCRPQLLIAAVRRRNRCYRLRGLKVHIRTASLLRHKSLRESRIALFQVLLDRTRLGQSAHKRHSNTNVCTTAESINTAVRSCG